MRHGRRCNDARSFQLDLLVADIGEQRPTRAEQDIGNVNLHLVYLSGLQILLANIRTHQTHGLIPGSGFGLLQGAFHPIRHKDERRWATL